MSSFDNCTKISISCPLSETTYGYYPSLPGNAILAAVFGICALSQVLLTIRFRGFKTYSLLVFVGCIGEVIGYVGRILLHSNPWSFPAYLMNSLLLIVSPSFLAAALYLTLKHTVNFYGPEFSVLKPKLYTWVFITCDAIGFLMQGIGGGLAASASSDSQSMLDIGNGVMIAGIAFQAGTMAVAGILAGLFVVRRHLCGHDAFARPSSRKETLRAFYLLCTTAAFVFILIRCIYRIPEMGGGWGNAMMKNEVEFMVLDGAMIAIGTILMCLGHPGPYAFAFTTGTGDEKDSPAGFELLRISEGEEGVRAETP